MENQLLQAVKIVENQVRNVLVIDIEFCFNMNKLSLQLDNEIERLDNLDESEIETIRKNRLEAMKNLQKQKIEWKNNGKLLTY